MVAVPDFNAEQREASCRAGNCWHFAEELCTGLGAGRNQRGGKRFYPTVGDLHAQGRQVRSGLRGILGAKRRVSWCRPWVAALSLSHFLLNCSVLRKRE